MCQFFKKRGYPNSAVTTGKHRAQEIDRKTALQTSQSEETDRIPFTLPYDPQNLAIKNAILKNFKILRNDLETKHIFPLPPLTSFKCDKNLGNFLVKSDAKLVPLFLTQLRPQDLIDALKSLTISPASPQMSSIA